MVFNAESLLTQLQSHRNTRRWFVGFSGGLDSTVLLHALAALKDSYEIKQPVFAIHINHGLSAQADHWQRHCEAFAAGLDVPIHCRRVKVAPRGNGIEAAARNARYQAFSEFMQGGDALLLAHQLDDQAETLLFRLLRGAGPRGLGGIVPAREFAGALLLRPLLPFSREQLRDYAEIHQLKWIDDESNLDAYFDRNYLRQQVMPLLDRRWPGFKRRWAQSAELCRATDQVTAELAKMDFDHCSPRRERLGASIDLLPLLNLSPARRFNLLRYWLHEGSYETPDLTHLREVDRQLLHGDSSGAEVGWGNVALRRFNERLFLLPSKILNKEWPRDRVVDWPAAPGGQLSDAQPPMTLGLPDGSMLEAVPTLGAGVKLDSAECRIARRHGGERCQPQQRGHSQTLKKLLQEYQLEPWLRDRVPLIFVDERLAAVGDLWVCKNFAAEPGAVGWVLRWHYGDPKNHKEAG